MAALRPQHIRLGIALIVLGAFVISVSDLVFQVFAGGLSLWQVFAVRGVITLPLLIALGFRHLPHFAQAFAPWPLLRAITFTATLLLFYAALPYLDLSVVGAANYTAPLFVALLAAWLLREGLGPRGWLGLGLGFGGILLLLKPGTGDFSPWVLLPLLGAVSYAISHTITRAKCQHLHPFALSFGQNFMMMASGFLFGGLVLAFAPAPDLAAAYPALLGPWPPLSALDWGVLVGLAVLTVTASTLLARAYQAAPGPIVATFEYTYLIFAAGWDTLRGNLPDTWALLGMVLIIVAGLIVLKRAPRSDRAKSDRSPT